jgi:hypothetical protein
MVRVKRVKPKRLLAYRPVMRTAHTPPNCEAGGFSRIARMQGKGIVNAVPFENDLLPFPCPV